MDAVRLEESQIDEATITLYQAFDNDPMLRYITLENNLARADIIKCFCQAILRYTKSYNTIYTTSKDLKGVAIWIPPGQFPINFVRLLQAGLYKLPFKLGWSGFNRWVSLFTLDSYHKSDMSQPHWYLLILGVIPTYQGQGIGSSLLQPILKQADAEKLPCYLETFTTASVRFFQKHGFKVLKTDQLPGNALSFWTMKREPI
ncbi:GCN5-like N-acetyltransferase [Dulcicalothrix desertica PCC 7102]|uniref:GCN5-like N-acetyltransferase n=1 Tax=Dulcicalothrix desertica PCC 7102 TaxID=232991 RepID=A0A3S1AKD8_9CYAN|nr:GNAT family N-acetyltransferase [Dulcicalothrix desertica]RUT02797.1 GCN5-like N-acetyltransferase [Dulcicalothrix desertica PCC 7102]TWH38969.1 N-acetylglutamate synthase and related acetyltransferases [Dulcicalothrix desertica PCC 7102]